MLFCPSKLCRRTLLNIAVLDQNPEPSKGANRMEASTVLVTVEHAFAESMRLDALVNACFPFRAGGSRYCELWFSTYCLASD